MAIALHLWVSPKLKMYFQLIHYGKEWVTPEKNYGITRRKLWPSRDGGVKCVKNVLNVHWMSGEGGGRHFHFPPWGGMDLF